MAEEENVSVETPESPASAQAPESEQVHDERPEDKSERRKRNDAEYNWAETRRKMQELERQNEEMRAQVSRITQPSKPSDEDDLGKLGDDDLISAAQAKRMVNKMAKQVAEEAIKQREAATVEERVNLKFPDYADVVTKENIEFLRQTEPELARTLSTEPDPYHQAVAAYKLIKRVQPKVDNNSSDKKKALENSQKPVSVQAVTKQSAIGNAHMFENGLTPELKKQLQAEMRQAIKGA